VLRQLHQANFAAVVGPTAAGKTTLIKAAAASDPRLHMLVAGTSRAMRPGEQKGVDFYFASRESMERKAQKGEYVTCVRHPSGDLYTTSPEEYPAGKTTLLATLSSAVEVFRQLPLQSFRTIYVLPPSYDAWQERLSQHPLAPEQLRRRMEEAAASLTFGLQDGQTQFMLNDDLGTAISDFIALAFGQPIQSARIHEQSRARTAAVAILAELTRVLKQG
jgi:guanylate kinase